MFDAGTNTWRDVRPLAAREAVRRKLYLQRRRPPVVRAPAGLGRQRRVRLRSGASGALSAAPHPVVRASGSRGTCDDQRFVDNRPDVRTWQTEPLDADVTIAGDVVAHALRLHHRHRRRLGGEADRRLPRQRRRARRDGRLPADGGERHHARAATARASSGRGRSGRTRCCPTRWTCTSRRTRSGRGTGSWCRCRAPGSRSTTATRRRSCPTSSRRRAADYRAQTHAVHQAARYPSHVEVQVLEQP